MRVLMTTMKLDIGGAETHIVELSKALARCGVTVFVASGGGAYEKELESAGIKHFTLPLQSKKPHNMLKCYRGLKKIIIENKIDVVHGHARIPSFICGKLQKKLNFPFVTTAHWVFKAGFPFNKLSDWGDRSLAVSEDIKQYLIDNYGLSGENIRVTINGIDTEKFSADTDFSDIKKEFNLGDNKKRIVYVSRMDIDRSLVAHHLIESVPALFERFPDLEVIIVGGGNDFDAVNAEAEAVNAQIGKRVIIVTGSRTDINKFAASGDVFIGVSRAALEAMACEKPSIIAGNEGYIGIFDKEKLPVSIDTNFCCRGCEPSTVKHLEQDIVSLFTERDLKELGKYSREVIKSRYSAPTMARDALVMYASVLKGTKMNGDVQDEEIDVEKLSELCVPSGYGYKNDVVISGYYGFGNCGDDSVLMAIISGLKKRFPKIRITVLSKNPRETEQMYSVRAISRTNLFDIRRIMRKSALLISGGGSLIQDVTSDKSLVYYLSVIRMAQKMGLKTMLYANGIGPIGNKKNYPKIKRVLDEADKLTLRDPESIEELRKIGVENPNVEVTADPVFSLDIDGKISMDKLMKELKIEGKRYFCVSVRKWKYLAQDFESSIVSACEYVYGEYGFIPLFIPMQQSWDKEICRNISAKLNCPFAAAERKLSPNELMALTAEAQFVIGMRLHILIYSACAATPFIGIEYDPKVSAVVKYVGPGYGTDAKTITSEKLISLCDDVLKNRDSIIEDMKSERENVRKLSEKNADIAAALLNDN